MAKKSLFIGLLVVLFFSLVCCATQTAEEIKINNLYTTNLNDENTNSSSLKDTEARSIDTKTAKSARPAIGNKPLDSSKSSDNQSNFESKKASSGVETTKEVVRESPKKPSSISVKKNNPLPPSVIKHSLEEKIIKTNPKKTQPESVVKVSNESLRSPKGSFRYLFVPLGGCDYDPMVLSASISDYADIFDIDMVVVTGDISELLGKIISSDFAKKYEKSFLRSKPNAPESVLFSKQKPRTGISDKIYDFNNFAISIFSINSQTLDEKKFNIGTISRKTDNDFDELLNNLSQTKKPIVIFTSPEESSYFDIIVMDLKDTGNDNVLKFTREIEEEGFIDMFNSLRYTAPTIGLLRPGYTYSSDTSNDRIDFVYAKSLIPVFTNVQHLQGLSTLSGVKRYAIMGEIEY